MTGGHKIYIYVLPCLRTTPAAAQPVISGAGINYKRIYKCHL